MVACGIIYLDLIKIMITDFDLKIIIPMLSICIFVISFLSFMIWQEKKLENLEKKSKK
jgi:hypothetical protein